MAAHGWRQETAAASCGLKESRDVVGGGSFWCKNNNNTRATPIIDPKLRPKILFLEPI
jgi:hypothetical protein